VPALRPTARTSGEELSALASRRARRGSCASPPEIGTLRRAPQPKNGETAAMHRSRLATVVIDCDDAEFERDVAFWSLALG